MEEIKKNKKKIWRRLGENESAKKLAQAAAVKHKANYLLRKCGHTHVSATLRTAVRSYT